MVEKKETIKKVLHVEYNFDNKIRMTVLLYNHWLFVDIVCDQLTSYLLPGMRFDLWELEFRIIRIHLTNLITCWSAEDFYNLD